MCRAFAFKLIRPAPHLEWCALDSDQAVDRHGLGVSRQRGKLVDETDAVALALAQPDDASRAHTDAGVADVGQRLQPVLILARGCDLRGRAGRGGVFEGGGAGVGGR